MFNGDGMNWNKRIFQLLSLLVLLQTIGFTSTGTASISSALSMLCVLFYQILPVGVLLAITLAGVIFAIGQTMGAETRARANVWATNLMIGALIAGAVIILAPEVIRILLGKTSISYDTCTMS